MFRLPLSLGLLKKGKILFLTAGKELDRETALEVSTRIRPENTEYIAFKVNT